MKKPRGFLSRAVAAATMLWFALVIAEPVPLDACPMHGAHSMHGMATSTMSRMPHSGRDAGAKTPPHQCTCIGDCSAGAATGLAATARVDLGVGVVFRAIALLRPASGTLQSADHRLPFSNGPPDLS